jgi:hypothetical protein
MVTRLAWIFDCLCLPSGRHGMKARHESCRGREMVCRSESAAIHFVFEVRKTLIEEAFEVKLLVVFVKRTEVRVSIHIVFVCALRTVVNFVEATLTSCSCCAGSDQIGLVWCSCCSLTTCVSGMCRWTG